MDSLTSTAPIGANGVPEDCIPWSSVTYLDPKGVERFRYTISDRNKRAEAQMERIEAGDQYFPLDMWDQID